jgi:hypothetical protein
MSKNILERITLTKEDIHGMINDAMKNSKSKENTDKVDSTTDISDDFGKIDPFSTFETFSNFIRKRYFPKGQSISGLDAFYKEVILSKNSDEIKNLISSEKTNKTLQQGEYPIDGTEADLYNIISDTIKIKNGHESELWFAIVFKGLVVGSRGETPDVLVKDDTISLKDYTNNVFDFGSLDSDTIKHLNKFISLAVLLTNLEVKSSLTVPSINLILDKLETEEMQSQVKDILELSKTSNIPAIDNLANQIKSLLNISSDINKKGIHNLVVTFCNDIDRLLEMKIKAAKWWGMILNKKLYLESSESVFDSIKCTENYRLSNAIAQFKSNHIYVNGLYLGSKISTKK